MNSRILTLLAFKRLTVASNRFTLNFSLIVLSHSCRHSWFRSANIRSEICIRDANCRRTPTRVLLALQSSSSIRHLSGGIAFLERNTGSTHHLISGIVQSTVRSKSRRQHAQLTPGGAGALRAAQVGSGTLCQRAVSTFRRVLEIRIWNLEDSQTSIGLFTFFDSQLRKNFFFLFASKQSQKSWFHSVVELMSGVRGEESEKERETSREWSEALLSHAKHNKSFGRNVFEFIANDANGVLIAHWHWRRP